MIRAEFFVRDHRFCGFSVSGHAGAAPAGSDIVCAAVSSAVYLTANAVTEVLGLAPELQVHDDGFLSLSVSLRDQAACEPFLKALWLHLGQLSQQYPKNLKVFQTEE